MPEHLTKIGGVSWPGLAGLLLPSIVQELQSSCKSLFAWSRELSSPLPTSSASFCSVRPPQGCGPLLRQVGMVLSWNTNLSMEGHHGRDEHCNPKQPIGEMFPGLGRAGCFQGSRGAASWGGAAASAWRKPSGSHRGRTVRHQHLERINASPQPELVSRKNKACEEKAEQEQNGVSGSRHSCLSEGMGWSGAALRS